MNIGIAVKEIRKRKHPNLKQYAFAKCVNISQTYLSQIENNQKTPNTDVLEKIAEFCEIPVSVLFWFSIEESEIHKSKKMAFKLLKPAIDELINQLIIS